MIWKIARIKHYQNETSVLELAIRNTGQLGEGFQESWIAVGCFQTSDLVFDDLLAQGSIERIILIEDQTILQPEKK